MKTAILLIAATIVFSQSDATAQGFFSKLRPKKNERVYTGQELANQEGRGTASFNKAKGYEDAGRLRAARDLYKSIAKSYPNTKVGAEAQFRLAQVREREGDSKKAFDEYQTLITVYRGSTHFKTAIARQFAIAEKLKTTKRKGFLGFGAGVQPSELRKMFEQIADAAPYSEYAPRSWMALGELSSKGGQKADAIRNYQTVVDNYRGTTYASDAQYQIYQLRGMAAENSNSPSEDRAQVDAALDFLANNPDDQRAEQVKVGLNEIESRALEKLFTTGQFYEKQGNLDSALIYYREVVKKPNSKHYSEAVARMDKNQEDPSRRRD